MWTAAALTASGADPAALADVTAALKNRVPAGRAARIAAIDAAELLPSLPPEIQNELVVLLDDRTPFGTTDPTTASVKAARALAKAAKPAKGVVAGLLKLTSDKDPAARKAAVESLGKIGPSAKEAGPRLRELVRLEPDLADAAEAAAAAIGK